MAYFFSVRELREAINTELRNFDTQPRYSDAEVNNAIKRAVALLRPYFWHEESTDSQTIVTKDYDYVYSSPVKDIFKVQLIWGDLPPKNVYDWNDTYDPITNQTTLRIYGDYQPGAVIRVWYEHHPESPPDDQVIATAVSTLTQTTVDVNEVLTTFSWPLTGYLEVSSSLAREYMSYSLAFTASGLSEDQARFTVVRGKLGSIAAKMYAVSDVVSFVLICESASFFEGVTDYAIALLNRMRIVDATSSDVAGNLTVMRQVMDDFPTWLRDHRMRSQKPPRGKLRMAKSLKRSWRRYV